MENVLERPMSIAHLFNHLLASIILLLNILQLSYFFFIQKINKSIFRFEVDFKK